MNHASCCAILLCSSCLNPLFETSLWSVLQVICERGSKLNMDTLAIMPYADATIKEALRLGAVINIVPKRALKTFEIGGYTIPKVRP